MTEEKTGLLALSVTGDCNLRCRYCYARGGEERTSMDWPKARRAIEVMAECFDSFKIQFTGGEPLLNLDLIDKVVKHLHESGLKVPCQVQTNATLINSDVAERLESLKIGVGVSLDGPPSLNDALRPFQDKRGSTGATLRGIAALRDAGVRVGATCVLSRANAGALARLVDMLSYLENVEGMAIDFLRAVGRAELSLQPGPDQAARGVEAAIMRSDHLASMGGRRIKFRELERMRSTLRTGGERLHHCYFDSCRSLVVLADGRSFTCPSLLYPEMMLGDIEQTGFAEGLLERMVQARHRIQDPLQCRRCPDLWLCGGPCLAHHVTSLGLSIECAVKRVFMRQARGNAGMADQTVCRDHG